MTPAAPAAPARAERARALPHGPEPVAPEPGPPGAARRARRRRAAETALLVVAAVAVAALAKTFFVEPFYIPSVSMVPTLDVNDRVLVSRMAYALHPPHRGDIVVFVAPRSEQPRLPPRRGVLAAAVHDVLEALGVVHPTHVDFIKRVIGLPGDTIEARDGHVYVDGHLLVEPYLRKGTSTSSFGPEVVPPHEVFVMGDNRTDSVDSRVFGPIPASSIIGRAFLRIWPPWRIGFL